MHKKLCIFISNNMLKLAICPNRLLYLKKSLKLNNQCVKILHTIGDSSIFCLFAEGLTLRLAMARKKFLHFAEYSGKIKSPPRAAPIFCAVAEGLTLRNSGHRAFAFLRKLFFECNMPLSRENGLVDFLVG